MYAPHGKLCDVDRCKPRESPYTHALTIERIWRGGRTAEVKKKAEKEGLNIEVPSTLPGWGVWGVYQNQPN
jgi:hypothetical protein